MIDGGSHEGEKINFIYWIILKDCGRLERDDMKEDYMMEIQFFEQDFQIYFYLLKLDYI